MNLTHRSLSSQAAAIAGMTALKHEPCDPDQPPAGAGGDGPAELAAAAAPAATSPGFGLNEDSAAAALMELQVRRR
jgi:hypothetical protein